MNRVLNTLTICSAIALASIAGFFSVSGLSMLFSGASVAVIIMASVLEVSKLIAASVLHVHWNTLQRILRGYLTAAVVLLMGITSLGIYGFLSSAYRGTELRISRYESEYSKVERAVNQYTTRIAQVSQEITETGNLIRDLSNVRSSKIEVRDTLSVSGVRNTLSTYDVRLAQNQIKLERLRMGLLDSVRLVLYDSLYSRESELFEVSDQKAAVSADLGPLLLISSQLGVDLDTVVFVLILIFVIVFDPLAITMVVVAVGRIRDSGNDSVQSDSELDRCADEPSRKSGVKTDTRSRPEENIKTLPK